MVLGRSYNEEKNKSLIFIDKKVKSDAKIYQKTCLLRLWPHEIKIISMGSSCRIGHLPAHGANATLTFSNTSGLGYSTNNEGCWNSLNHNLPNLFACDYLEKKVKEKENIQFGLSAA